MFVWHWVQQHRFLSVIALALIIVSCAGGTAWALVFRTVSSPVGLREALRMYRKEQTGKVLAALRNKLPAPGSTPTAPPAARASTSSGVARSFPASTSMIVDDGRCATVSWVPITQHTEVTTVCNAPNGALTVPKLVTDESIAGLDHHVDDRVPGVGVPAAAGARTRAALGAPPARWPARRRRSDWRARRWVSRPWVAGQPVAVTHARLMLTFTGAEHGTNPTDFWIVPSSGLIVRENGDGGRDPGRRPLQREHGRHAHRARPGPLSPAH